jgi:hypothetical protein
MSKHEYGPEYTAYCASLYLKSHLPRRLGYNPRNVEHHGKSSIFKLGERACKLSFEQKKGEDLTSRLEISEGGTGEEYEIPSGLIKRSRSGKVSGNHYEGFSDFFKCICTKSEQFGEGRVA